MKSSEVLIKWIGTKRLQSTQIIKYFPQTINCYYEVFLGGGAMLFTLLSSKINVKKIVCVDLNTSLIGIYQLVITDPNKLYESYLTHWNNLDTEGKYYYQLRQEFNNDKDPLKFFFLLRTCRNGLVRYNKQGNFNSAFHFKRHGVMPEKLKQTINLWHEKLRNQDITFVNDSYETVQSTEGDFIYLDPPYATPKNQPIYYGMIDYDKLWNWMKQQPAKYALSLNGWKDDHDLTINVPTDIYNEYLLIDNGLAKLDQLCHKRVIAKDSLYLKT